MSAADNVLSLFNCFAGVVAIWALETEGGTDQCGVPVDADDDMLGFPCSQSTVAARPRVLQLVPIRRFCNRFAACRPLAATYVRDVAWLHDAKTGVATTGPLCIDGQRVVSAGADNALRFWCTDNCYDAETSLIPRAGVRIDVMLWTGSCVSCGACRADSGVASKHSQRQVRACSVRRRLCHAR